ncbi:hypothetical protein SAMN05444397_102386 [Flavobacterium aquidurense]|uniref:Lipoprotein n=1 Tax=Flavobacterium frigidimaris TaxID=262320 RepID=A0ABX4BQF8_FLAFR|nr:hypothetical protein [Flavobacterium frigidimaris]OXA79144.1 hypothetical protein B0A65_11395 [Flavobacterium frigidimaris]SDY83829.1 hypothetical protein SAMN05444397_102386 [Flavobacterium aquidurense]
MKKLLLLSAFALLFTIFSCTADEYETQPKKKTEKIIDHSKSTQADGPGDEPKLPPPPPPTDE